MKAKFERAKEEISNDARWSSKERADGSLLVQLSYSEDVCLRIELTEDNCEAFVEGPSGVVLRLLYNPNYKDISTKVAILYLMAEAALFQALELGGLCLE